jgi:hypothetical protein
MKRIDLGDLPSALELLGSQPPVSLEINLEAGRLMDAMTGAAPENVESTTKAVREFIAISEEHSRAVQMYLAMNAMRNSLSEGTRDKLRGMLTKPE